MLRALFTWATVARKLSKARAEKERSREAKRREEEKMKKNNVVVSEETE